MDPKEFLESNLTKSQYFIWTGQKMSPNDPIYNAALTFELLGPINLDVFQQSFSYLVKTCDTLRTVFEEREGIPKQVVLDKQKDKIDFIDLSMKKSPFQEAEKFIDRCKIKVIEISKQIFDTYLIKIHNSQYIWFLNVHHLVTDAWSSSVLFHTMSQIYASILSGKEVDVEVYPYEKFRLEEKEIRDKDNSNQASYWDEKAREVEALKLYGKKPGFSTVTRKLKIEFGQHRSTLIKQLAREKPFLSFNSDLSIYNLFSTLIFSFLYKISQEKKISFGTPTHNRTKPEYKKTPGLFIEFFPLTVHISEGETFVSLFDKVRNEVHGFLKNAKPGISRAEINRNFNVLFNFTNIPFGEFAGIKTNTIYHSVGHNDPRHDLVIQINDFDGRGEFKIEFDLNLEKDNEIIYNFISDQFLSLFDQIVADQEISLTKIDIIGRQEKDYLLNTINDTAVHYPEGFTLIDLFQESVKKWPRAIVAQQGTKMLTYSELEQLSNYYASKIKDLGVLEGKIVAICLERSIEMLVAMIAIQKAGAAYLPIEPSYPISRIKYMINDSEAVLVISNHDILKKSGLDDKKGLNLDILNPVQVNDSHQHLNIARPELMAYVIYTSGSTGEPKGVMVSHEAIYNRIQWMQDLYPIDPSDKILQKTPYTFDVSVWEFFWPLITGSRIVFTKPDGHKDPNYIRDILNSEAISVVHFVPSMMAEFLTIIDLDNCISLKYTFSSGEVLPKNVHDTYLKTFPDCLLVNLYGPTEAAVDITHWNCQLDNQADDIPIGYAVPNTQIYILDDNKNLLPYGLSGNLFVGGKQIAVGYINNSKLTAKKFLENHLSSSKTLYDTGDVAKYRGDGILHYEGRKDLQVKISGLRIELGEIESAFMQHPDIENVAVLLHKNATVKLIAFYNGKNVMTNESIRGHLRKILPEYMLPSTSHFVEKMPLTANGKIDRKALQKFSTEAYQLNTKDAYHPPSNELEKIIQDIWQDVFGNEQISIYDDFLELGGHSLLAIKICSRILDAIELKVPVNLIFEYPTIARLSNQMEQLMIELMAKQDN